MINNKIDTKKINILSSNSDGVEELILNSQTILFENLAKWLTLFKTNNISSKVEIESIALGDETNSIKMVKPSNDDFDVFYNNFINVISTTSKYDVFEAGVISNTSIELVSFFSKNANFTKKSIQKIFHDMYDNPQLLIGILDGISSINYNLAKEELPIVATAALSHEDDEVVEYAIRCFENWRNINSLRILEKLKCREEWMNIYIKKIVEELKKELS